MLSQRASICGCFWYRHLQMEGWPVLSCVYTTRVFGPELLCPLDDSHWDNLVIDGGLDD